MSSNVLSFIFLVFLPSKATLDFAVFRGLILVVWFARIHLRAIASFSSDIYRNTEALTCIVSVASQTTIVKVCSKCQKQRHNTIMHSDNYFRGCLTFIELFKWNYATIQINQIRMEALNWCCKNECRKWNAHCTDNFVCQ